MILESRFPNIGEEVPIGLDEDDITGISWLQMPLREWDEAGYARDPITSSIQIIDQSYYSDIVI